MSKDAVQLSAPWPGQLVEMPRATYSTIPRRYDIGAKVVVTGFTEDMYNVLFSGCPFDCWLPKECIALVLGGDSR